MDRTAFLHDIQKIAIEIRTVKKDFDRDMTKLCNSFDTLVADFEKKEAQNVAKGS